MFIFSSRRDIVSDSAYSLSTASAEVYQQTSFDFDIVNFPFLDGDVPGSTSYGVYISQLIRFARVSSHDDDFNTRNKILKAKLLRQGYRYHKIRKAFSKFYRRHFDIMSIYKCINSEKLLVKMIFHIISKR